MASTTMESASNFVACVVTREITRSTRCGRDSSAFFLKPAADVISTLSNEGNQLAIECIKCDGELLQVLQNVGHAKSL